MRTTIAAIAIGLSVLTGLPAASHGQDPLSLYPENYKVLFENDRVRVLDFRLKNGARENAHTHPAHVAVFLENFKIRFTLPDGKTAIRDAHPGEVSFSETVTHASENVGGTDAHGILVELKAPPARGQ
jgi:quercetin dioxygenase-like cupin family protein